MLYHIKHVNRFRYSKAVFCEPTVIRLRPRENACQRLIRYRLDVRPEPAGTSHYLDLEGNACSRVWFNALTPNLSITAISVVEARCDNPFEFLLEPDAATLPPCPPASQRSLFQAYVGAAAAPPSVKQLADETAARGDGSTLDFLGRLAARLHDEFSYAERDEGGPWPATKTLHERSGACRDLAVLFNEACRALGIPARFVSGYSLTDPNATEHHLHAWSEVYLPGAGWRGYDPSLGLAVAHQHVPLAAAASYANAAPLTGTFRGSNARACFEAQVIIRRLEDEANQRSDGRVLAEI